MKQITINIPDNCELKKDGNTYTIVEKEEEKLTYEDIAKELFAHKQCFYTDGNGKIIIASSLDLSVTNEPNNCTSKKQVEKLLAINKLMNVAKYLNEGWQPDFDYKNERKYYFCVEDEQIRILYTDSVCCIDILFKSLELAKQAIDILGEETIKLALCTDY